MDRYSCIFYCIPKLDKLKTKRMMCLSIKIKLPTKQTINTKNKKYVKRLHIVGTGSNNTSRKVLRSYLQSRNLTKFRAVNLLVNKLYFKWITDLKLRLQWNFYKLYLKKKYLCSLKKLRIECPQATTGKIITDLKRLNVLQLQETNIRLNIKKSLRVDEYMCNKEANIARSTSGTINGTIIVNKLIVFVHSFDEYCISIPNINKNVVLRKGVRTEIIS